jgi:hypothetical protein
MANFRRPARRRPCLARDRRTGAARLNARENAKLPVLAIPRRSACDGRRRGLNGGVHGGAASLALAAAFAGLLDFTKEEISTNSDYQKDIVTGRARRHARKSATAQRGAERFRSRKAGADGRPRNWAIRIPSSVIARNCNCNSYYCNKTIPLPSEY